MPSLIVDPDLPYAELAGRLRALEWQWHSESQQLPTIPGEPEQVVWAHDEPKALLSYTFNPVVRLRVLAFSGRGANAHCGRVASFVPHLTGEDIAQLLQSGTTESTLLGLFAAQELGLLLLLPLISALFDHPDALVASAARRVAEALPGSSADLIRDHLVASAAEPEANELAEHPAARLSLFAQYADASIRRQVLRYAGRDLHGDERGALEFLVGAGLADPDWEVRASAMLLAGRRGLESLAEVVASVALPEDDRFGHTAADVRRLGLLRRAVLHRLAGRPSPGEPELRHALTCVCCETDGVFDALFLLVFALTTPLELGPGPETVPPGIVRTDAGFALARSRLTMTWIAPIPCWLGDPETLGDVANPLRRVVPGHGFFIGRRPLSVSMVDWARAGGKGPSGVARVGGEGNYLCSESDAGRALAELSASEGVEMVLPTADQWEIAARGPDGRRYPWGNGMESVDQPSAWGLEGVVGKHPHWTDTVDDDRVIVCGGAGLRCAERRHWREGPGVVRPVVLTR